MNRPTQNLRAAQAFTLVEILTSVAIFGIASALLFSMLQVGTVLLAKNTGVNMTNRNARLGSERLLSLVHSAVAAPVLTNSSLVPVSGNGPAAGITFLRLASPSTYTSVNVVAATATSLLLRRVAGMPRPEIGDTLVMVGTDFATYIAPNIIGFQATITAVSNASSTDDTVSFSGPIGGFCDPSSVAGNVMPANSKLFLLDKMACVAVGKELRLMNNASNPTSYDVTAQLAPVIDGELSHTPILPFTYTTSTRRWVDVDLRIESTTYNKRSFSINKITGKRRTSDTFFNLKESIAYRSAIVVQNVQ